MTDDPKRWVDDPSSEELGGFVRGMVDDVPSAAELEHLARRIEGKVAGSGSGSNGGASDGGASDGGASNGGASNGGASNGGASNGGASNGSASNGGASNGGASNGGASNGASTPSRGFGVLVGVAGLALVLGVGGWLPLGDERIAEPETTHHAPRAATEPTEPNDSRIEWPAPAPPNPPRASDDAPESPELPESPESPVSAESPPARAAATAERSSAEARGARRSSESTGMADEVALLRAARSALHDDPSRALALTRTHEARFPDGAFTEEREVIAIGALDALGREEAARRRAEAFTRRWPSSAHHARLRELRGN